MRSSFRHSLVTYHGCVRGAWRIDPCQSDIWWLKTARRTSYQPVLVRIYRNCAILEAWLPSEAWLLFMACWICILRTLLSGWSFLFRIYANCGAIAVVATLITTPTSILNDNKYYQWKQKEAPKLLVKGNRFWSRSIITTTDLASCFDMGMILHAYEFWIYLSTCNFFMQFWRLFYNFFPNNQKKKGQCTVN